MKYKVCNKQIHQDVFNFESSIHNFAFFNEKLNMFESGEICTDQAIYKQPKTVLNEYVMGGSIIMN